MTNLETFTNEKHSLFLNDLPKVEKILKSYGIKIASKKNHVEETNTDRRRTIYRVHLEINRTKDLSERQEANLEKRLRATNIPMPICPIKYRSIELCYHN